MQKLKYDSLDLIIIEALGKLTPRNIHRISKHLNIPETTVRYRIEMLRNNGLLILHTNIYHSNLGLKKGVVFVESNPVYANYIDQFLRENDYWLYIKKTHGNIEGAHALYTVPVKNQNLLIEFLEELKKLDLIYNYEIEWSTCFHRVNPTTTWFNLKKEVWEFKWNELIDEFEMADTDLPVTLRDPADYPILADETDIFILKELEKDATIPLTEIAKKLNTTVQALHYHYKQHIMKNYLIEDFQVYLEKFDRRISVSPIFLIEFTKYNYLAKMANVLRNKPFIEIIGKILKSNKLLINAYLPIFELFNMLHILNDMASRGIIKNYKYYILSLTEKGRRQTLPYKLFRNKQWIYEHDIYLQRIHNKLKILEKITKCSLKS